MSKFNLALLSQECDSEEVVQEDMTTHFDVEAIVDEGSTERSVAAGIAVEIDELQASIGEGFEVADTLNKIHGKYEESMSQGGMSESAAQAIELAVEHMRARLGFNKKTTVSFEGFKNKMTRPKATKVAMEGFVATIKSVMASIIKGLKAVVDWLRGFFTTIFSARGRQASQTENIDKMCKAAEEAQKRASQQEAEIAEALQKAAEEQAQEEQAQKVNAPQQPVAPKPIKALSNTAYVKGLDDEEVENFKKVQAEAISLLMPLKFKDYPMLRLEGRVLGANDLVEMVTNTVTYLRNVTDLMYSDKSIDKLRQEYENILDNITSSEDRRVAISELSFYDIQDELLSGKFAESSKTSPEHSGFEIIQSKPMVGDYALSFTTPKDRDRLDTIEENLNQLKISLHNETQYLNTEFYPQQNIDKIKPAQARALMASMKDLQLLLDVKKTNDILEVGVVLLDKAIAAAKAISNTEDDEYDQAAVSAALGVSSMYNACFTDLSKEIVVYLGKLTNDVNRYCAACAKQVIVANSLARKVLGK